MEKAGKSPGGPRSSFAGDTSMHFHDRTKNHNRTVALSLALDKNARQVRVFTLTEMEPVFEILESWMRFLGFPKKDIFAVWLTVQEAVTNAFRHGNRNQPGKCVVVRYLVTPSEVLVEVQDDGNGFEVDNVPNPLDEENRDRPSGRGIFLMRAYTSWVSFNPQGNCVLLCRHRSND
jgi:serine/threonine-protein kinase RsbW